MKTIKRILASVLLLCMLSAMLVIPASAEGEALTFNWPALSFSSAEIGQDYVTLQVTNLTETETVSWKSNDTTVVTVDAATGKVTVVGVGATTIDCVVTGGAADRNASINVSVEADQVIIENTVLSFTEGSFANFTAKHKFGEGAVTWESSNPSAATIDAATGALAAVKEGTTTITARSAVDSKAIPASVEVSVIPVAVGSVTLDKNILNLTAGGTPATLTASVLPENASNKTVSWRSDKPDIASVDNGVVTPKAEGTATITVTSNADNSKSAICTVNVGPAPVAVTSVTVSPATLSLSKGSSSTLSVTVLPGNATNKTVNWSSNNEDAVIVDQSGKVTAVGSGSATITASADGQSGSCVVSVADKDATGIRVSPKTITLTSGSSSTLNAILTPSDATNAVSWSSNSTAVTVNAVTGEITAASGIGSQTQAIITASVTTSDNKTYTDTCTVTVTPVVTGVTISGVNTLAKGASANLTATISPAGAGGIVIWESLDPTVVKVESSTGKVTALSPGTARIIAKVGSISSPEHLISVPSVAATSISLNKTQLTLAEGASETLSYKLNPTNSTDTVTWTSSNSAYVSVDQNGKVTANAAGQPVTITATTSSGVSANCAVTVNAAPTSYGELTVTSSVKTISSVGGTAQLYAKIGERVIPSGSVSWSVDPSMASVSASGVVTPRKAGSFVVNGLYDEGGVRYSGSVYLTAAPIITYGNYSTYDGKNIMYFKTNEVYTAWSANHKVVVDGYVLTHGQHCYVGSSPDGYVLVALNPSFLNYLSPSVVHTIQIGVPGAAATGYFKAYGYSSSIYGVKTGDESQPALWAALCMMSVLGMGAILIIRRKDLRG